MPAAIPHKDAPCSCGMLSTICGVVFAGAGAEESEMVSLAGVFSSVFSAAKAGTLMNRDVNNKSLLMFFIWPS
jgi:hypothetical protein